MKHFPFSTASPQINQARRGVNHLSAKHLETTDIFHSAFFLCMGGDLAEIRFKNKNGSTATFTITGRGLDRLDRDYRTGKARVNPLQLRDSLNRLRDILFEKKREREGRKRR